MIETRSEMGVEIATHETKLSIAAIRYIGKLGAVLITLTTVSFGLQMVSERINGRREWLEYLIDAVVLGCGLYLFARFFVGTARRTEASIINRAISMFLGDIPSATNAARYRLAFFGGFLLAATICLYAASPLTWFSLSGSESSHLAWWIQPVHSRQLAPWIENTLIWVCFQVLFANLLLQASWQFGTIWSDDSARVLLKKSGWRLLAEEFQCNQDVPSGELFGTAADETATSEPRPQNERAVPVRIIHWSDLHIQCGDVRIEDQEASGGGATPLRNPDEAFQVALKHAAHSMTDVGVLLITGDVTDRGSERQWKFFREQMLQYPELATRVIVLPGNHDTNINCSDATVIDRSGIGRANTLMRMLRTLVEIHGERSEVFSSEEGLVPLPRYFRRNIEVIEKLSPASEAFVNHVRDTWDGAYPMVFRVSRDIAIICLDSVGPSSHLLSNAFGRVESEALTRLASVQRLLFGMGYSCVYAMHHQLVWPRDLTTIAKKNSGLREKMFRKFQSRFMVVEDAPKLMSTLDAANRTTVMFHGHKHIGYVRRLGGNLLVASAASTTYGDETGRKEQTDGAGRFRLFTVLSKPDRGVEVSWSMIDSNIAAS